MTKEKLLKVTEPSVCAICHRKVVRYTTVKMALCDNYIDEQVNVYAHPSCARRYVKGEVTIMLEHYVNEAIKWGDSSSSTMEDDVVRQKEVELISSFIGTIADKSIIVDVGCGNGYTLEVLSKVFPSHHYWGLDLTPELLAIAKNRSLSNCKFALRSVHSLPFETNILDVVFTERCLTNVLTWSGQLEALNEIYRVLRPGGYYLMIECFTNGLDNNNRARLECGLTELKAVSFNNYIDKELFLDYVMGKFIIEEALVPYNFLSSHYFIARVLYALVTRGEQVKNTDFVKFFSFLPPIGNYSQIQAYVLRKVL